MRMHITAGKSVDTYAEPLTTWCDKKVLQGSNILKMFSLYGHLCSGYPETNEYLSRGRSFYSFDHCFVGC